MTTELKWTHNGIPHSVVLDDAAASLIGSFVKAALEPTLAPFADYCWSAPGPSKVARDSPEGSVAPTSDMQIISINGDGHVYRDGKRIGAVDDIFGSVVTFGTSVYGKTIAGTWKKAGTNSWTNVDPTTLDARITSA